MGHRVLPHTADVIVEAWAPTRSECLEEIVRAVVGTFADVGHVHATRRVAVEVSAADDEDLVVALIEDVCLLLDAEGLVVVDIALAEHGDNGDLDGTLFVAPLRCVVPAGAAPKGVSRSDLQFAREGSQWRAHAIVDV